MRSYDLMMVGHLSKDILVYGGREEQLVGGAVVYSSAAARASGAAVLVVTKTSAADRRLLDPIKARGIEVEALSSPETTSIHNLYESEDRERRTVTLLARAEGFKPAEIPAVEARIIQLAGLFRNEIPDELIGLLAGRAPLGLDAQGVLRASEGGRLEFRDWEAKKELLPLVTYLKTDAAEARILTGLEDREEAARVLHGWGAKEVMVTHNREVIVFDGKRICRAPFNPANLSGRTGRGDTCFASFLTWRLGHGIEESVYYAAALTSIKMETPGVFSGSVARVRERMAASGWKVSG